MDKVQDYYSKKVADNIDLFGQVGKTIKGKSVGNDHLQLIVKQIVSALSLSVEDKVLDFGCGNGLITREIASKVSYVHGIEQNKALYESALENSAAKNISYMISDIFSFDTSDSTCNKAYMYEVIQHIEPVRLPDLMDLFKDLFSDGAMIFIGGIPDEEKKWDFYDTYDRRCGLLQALIDSGDPMGNWFHKDYLICLGESYDLSVNILPQPDSLYTSHYRFDCLIELR